MLIRKPNQTVSGSARSFQTFEEGDLEASSQFGHKVAPGFIDGGLFLIPLVKDVVETQIKRVLALRAEVHTRRQIERGVAAESIATRVRCALNTSLYSISVCEQAKASALNPNPAYMPLQRTP